MPTQSAELMAEWYEFAASMSGRYLSPNHIDSDDAEGTLLYEVPDGDPPLILKNGVPTRVLALSYDLKDVQNEPRH